MAAVTVNRKQHVVLGNLRAWIADVDAAGTGDTFESGFSVVLGVVATPATGIGMGATISGSEVTIVYAGGGAAADIQLIVFGQ